MLTEQNFLASAKHWDPYRASLCEIIRVRVLSPHGPLLPWALVLGPGTAKLFISFFFFFSFWVGSVLRNRNSSEKAPAAMSHS